MSAVDLITDRADCISQILDQAGKIVEATNHVIERAHYPSDTFAPAVNLVADLERSIAAGEPNETLNTLRAYAETELSDLMQTVINALRQARG